MPQLDITTYVGQLFWLLVTFVVLFFVLSRVALPRISGILEARQGKIDDDLDRAAAFKRESEEVLEEYQKSMAESTATAQALLREAAEEAAAEAARRHGELAETLAAQVEEAEARIEQAKAEAKANIDQVAGEVAQSALRRLLGQSVDEATAREAVAAAARGNA